MARTLDEIVQAILSDKNSRPALNSLNSTSQASVWRNWVYIAGQTQLNLEIIQDRFADEVNAIIAANVVGTPIWYQEKSLEFQLGYDLTLNGYSYSYPVIDEASKIIAAASVTEQSGSTLFIKVAKEESSGDLLEALSSTEKQQFSKYITKIKLAGTKINIVSLAADQLIMSGCTIYFDAIYDVTVVKSRVEDALTNYTKNIPFDGTVKRNSIIDVLQAVEGVEDVELDNLAIKSGSDINSVDRIATLPSGYINEADAPYSFDELIEYIPV